MTLILILTACVLVAVAALAVRSHFTGRAQSQREAALRREVERSSVERVEAARTQEAASVAQAREREREAKSTPAVDWINGLGRK